MQPRRDPNPPASDDRGFALVTVLWIAGLLAVMTAGLSLSVRTHVRVVANVAESAKAEALADAGAALAVIDLMAARGSGDHRRRFPPDGRAVACSIPGEGVLSIAISDEAAKIDVNSAGIPLIRALLSGLGVPAEKSAQLAEAIFDFRDADDDRKPSGAESAEYRAAGLGWLPKNGPLQSLDELSQVYGLTPALLARIRPHVSVYTGLEGFDASIAKADLIALLRSGIERSGGSLGGLSEFDEAIALPAIFVSPSAQRFFGLRVEARGATGAVFVREAVLDVGDRHSPRHVFLRWARGALTPDAPVGASQGKNAPAC
jgi:general secretion pathway protein K